MHFGRPLLENGVAGRDAIAAPAETSVTAPIDSSVTKPNA